MAGALSIPLDKFSNCLFSTSLGTQRCPGWSYRYTRLYLINFQRPKLNFRYEKRSTQLRINLETKLKTFPWLSWSYPIKMWGKLVEGILSNDRTNKQTNRDYTLIYRWQNVKKIPPSVESSTFLPLSALPSLLFSMLRRAPPLLFSTQLRAPPLAQISLSARERSRGRRTGKGWRLSGEGGWRSSEGWRVEGSRRGKSRWGPVNKMLKNFLKYAQICKKISAKSRLFTY